jgi:large subunit ribosomal protein L10
MPQTRDQKAELIAQYQQGLAAAPHAFVLGFQGIKVMQVTDLRRRIREKGGHYEVVKNTLALRAMEGKALEQLKEHFVGPTAVVYVKGDPVGVAKALTDFRKEAPVIEFKAALVENRPILAEQIDEIAKLPSRDALIAKLLFLLQSPVQRFVRCLNAIPQQMVIVLDQIAQKKQ